MDWIDLRSDTVTHPTQAMRTAMSSAEVGDDVYGEDPTVNRLQEIAAEKLGMEAGLFVPSGTMGNLAAIMAHCSRGEEVLLGDLAHTYLYEAGGTAVLGGIPSFILPNQRDGTIHLRDIEGAIHADDVHQPRTRLICLENTHNRCGASVITLEYTREICAFAHEEGLLVHIDGARIFNASVALGVPVSDLSSPADSVTFCLSKGLGAPVGSVICGSRDFIEKAHRIRKQLGGGMRQAGILAAAGIVALESMVDRLVEDHHRATRFSEAIGAYDDVELEYPDPSTNMVFFTLREKDPHDFVSWMREQGVLINMPRGESIRVVFHHQVDDDMLSKAISSVNLFYKNA